MSTNMQVAPVSKAALWIGRVMSGVIVLLFAFSAVMKLVQAPAVADGFKHLEWPVNYALGLGVLELACAIIYAIPRTAVLGAVLLTGYLGGAIATHVRIGEQVIPHIIFGLMIWGGLYLRDPRLRALLPLRNLV